MNIEFILITDNFVAIIPQLLPIMKIHLLLDFSGHTWQCLGGISDSVITPRALLGILEEHVVWDQTKIVCNPFTILNNCHI